MLQRPQRGISGICTVCGYAEGGHGWDCISFFMMQALAGYKEDIRKVRGLLQRLHDGEQLTKQEVAIYIRSITFHEDVIRELASGGVNESKDIPATKSI